MAITCPICTFVNDEGRQTCGMCEHPFVEQKADASFITDIFTTENAGILSAFFIACLELVLGVDISLSCKFGTLLHVVTAKEDGIKITLMQSGKGFGHYTLVTSNGSELDFGIYNTAPLNIPSNVKTSYFQCLNKNGWGKNKHGNCCLPMCIIIGVLMHQQELQQELQDLEIARKHQQELQDLEFARMFQTLGL